MYKYILNPKHMNSMYGANKFTLTVGNALIVGGLLTAATGFILSQISIGGPFRPDEYDLAHEFVDAILA